MSLNTTGFAVAHKYLLQRAVDVTLKGSPMVEKLNQIGNVHVQPYGTHIEWQVDYAENSYAGAVSSEGGTITDGTPSKAAAYIATSTYAVKWSYTKKLIKAILADPTLAWYKISEETKKSYTSLIRAISEDVINGSGSSGALTGFTTALSAATGSYGNVSRTNAWWQPAINDDVSDRDLDEDYLNDVYDTCFNYNFVGANRVCATATQQWSNIKALGQAKQRVNSIAGQPAGISLGANPNEAYINDIPFWFMQSNQSTHPLLNSFYFLNLDWHHIYFIGSGDLDVEQVSNENAVYTWEGTVEVTYVIEQVRGQGYVGHIND